MKPKAQVIKLKTLDMQATMPNETFTPLRPHKKRVFTEDEWRFLNTLSTAELFNRMKQGEILTKMLENYEWLNMTHGAAKTLTSNLHYQMDAIESIIKGRNGHG